MFNMRQQMHHLDSVCNTTRWPKVALRCFFRCAIMSSSIWSGVWQFTITGLSSVEVWFFFLSFSFMISNIHYCPLYFLIFNSSPHSLNFLFHSFSIYRSYFFLFNLVLLLQYLIFFSPYSLISYFVLISFIEVFFSI